MDGVCGNINHMHVSAKCPPSVCVARLLCLLHFHSSLAGGAKETRPAPFRLAVRTLPLTPGNVARVRHGSGWVKTASWTKGGVR